MSYATGRRLLARADLATWDGTRTAYGLVPCHMRTCALDDLGGCVISQVPIYFDLHSANASASSDWLFGPSWAKWT